MRCRSGKARWKTKKKCRRRPAAAAPPRRPVRVGLRQSALELAPPRARAWGQREGVTLPPLSVLQNLAIVGDDPVPRCPRPAPAPSPARRPHHHHRSPRSPDLHRRPEPESANNNFANKKCRRRPAAAAPPRRPVQVGLRQSALESAPPRARAWGQREGVTLPPLSVLQNLAIVGDDPVPRCPRPAPAPSPARRPHHHHRSPRSPDRHRRPEPESANNNFAKKKCRRRPAAAAPPRRPVQVGLRQSALESAPPRARAWGQREGVTLPPLSVLQNLAIVGDDPVAGCARPAPAPSPARRPHHHHRSPRSPDRHRRPEPESANNNFAKKKCRRRPAAAAPPRRPVQVGLRQSALESAPPRARAWGQREGVTLPPLSVLQNLAIVGDDPVAGCARPAPAPSPARRPHHHHRSPRSPDRQRPPPTLPTPIPRKRNVDVGQQPQRRPAGRCRSVCLRARWNRRRLARARGAARRVTLCSRLSVGVP